MKKLLLVAACIAASVAAMAQGTVNFSNTPASLGTGAPVFDADGTTKLAGTAYLVQLYAGPNATSLQPIGAAVGFRTGAAAGYFDSAADPARTIATVAPGAVATIQVKAWEAAGGATFELASASGKKYGVSNTFTVKTGGDGSPPSLPANLVGLTSFSLIPEPSTIALGLLGAAALVLIRRK